MDNITRFYNTTYLTFLSFDVLEKAVCSQAHISDVYELLTAPPNSDFSL